MEVGEEGDPLTDAVVQLRSMVDEQSREMAALRAQVQEARRELAEMKAAGEGRPPAAATAVRVVAAAVAMDGSLISSCVSDGSATVSAQSLGDGKYVVQFVPPFADLPAVVLTQMYPTPTGFCGDTRDNCVVGTVTLSSANVRCGDSNGRGSSRSFHIVAVGRP